MGNQALNSLALISARYAFVAIDVLSQLAAAHLFALCQALDLRAMQISFLDAFEPVFRADTDRLLANLLDVEIDRARLFSQLWLQFQKMWEQTSSLDPGPRFASIFRSLTPTVLDFTTPSSTSNTSSLREWTKNCSQTALKIFVSNRDAYSADPDARPYLGMASRRMYDIVRNQLAVPFVRTDELEGELSIGSLITKVYSSIRNGSLYGPVMECLMEVERDGVREKRGGAKL